MIDYMQTHDWKKYVIVFFITVALFITAIVVSSKLNEKKFSSLKSIQDKIAVDLLSSEVQYSLLEEQSCSDVTNSVLSQELGNFAEKIEYSENNNIGTIEDLNELKKNYSLLEIKDYLLMKKVTRRCGIKSSFILYFYTTSNECVECTKQSIVLTSLREKYPELRVYSFDYNLDLSAVKALIAIYKIPNNLPAIVINEKTYAGFQDMESIEKIVGPALKPVEKAIKKSTTKTIPASATIEE